MIPRVSGGQSASRRRSHRIIPLRQRRLHRLDKALHIDRLLTAPPSTLHSPPSTLPLDTLTPDTSDTSPKLPQLRQRRPHHRLAGRQVLVDLERVDVARLLVEAVGDQADIARGDGGGHPFGRHRAQEVHVAQRAQPGHLAVVQAVAEWPDQRQGPVRSPLGQLGQQSQIELGVDPADHAEDRSRQIGHACRRLERRVRQHLLKCAVVHGVGHVVRVRIDRPPRLDQAARRAEDQVGAGGEGVVELLLLGGLLGGQGRVGAVLVDHVIDHQLGVELVQPVELVDEGLLPWPEQPQDRPFGVQLAQHGLPAAAAKRGGQLSQAGRAGHRREWGPGEGVEPIVRVNDGRLSQIGQREFAGACVCEQRPQVRLRANVHHRLRARQASRDLRLILPDRAGGVGVEEEDDHLAQQHTIGGQGRQTLCLNLGG